MVYLVYKTTNIINGNSYVGVHKTDNPCDGYLGSGKILKSAITKYGTESFTREILAEFDNPRDAYALERVIVDENYVLREDTYNLKIGGAGGWDFINATGISSIVNSSSHISEEVRTIRRITGKRAMIKINADPNRVKDKIALLDKHRPDWTGRTHTEITKRKQSESAKGRGKGPANSQFGTKWITNGIETKKIPNGQSIPIGWISGRKIVIKDGQPQHNPNIVGNTGSNPVGNAN